MDSLYSFLSRISEVFGRIPFGDVFEILHKLVNQLGPPPALEEEDKLRDWIKKLGVIMMDIAVKTDTTADDKTVKLINSIIADDETWDFVYALIVQLMGSGHVPELVLEQAAERLENIGPLELLSIIRSIIDILRLMNDREIQP